MVVLITGNEDKVKEWSNLIPIETQKIDFEEIQGTVEEIAQHKCRQAYDIVKKPCLVEDVALYIDGMNGLPGPYIKCFIPMGLEKLCKLAQFGNGTIEAICVICYHDGKTIHTIKGKTQGTLVPPRGNYFGWDPIFEYKGKTFGEMSKDEKNKVSHRAKAIEKFMTLYKTLSNN